MRRSLQLVTGSVLALTSAWAAAQSNVGPVPSRTVPSGTARGAPSPGSNASPRSGDGPEPTIVSHPVVQQIGPSNSRGAPAPPKVQLPSNLPTLHQLETMSPDELDDLLGLKPKYDIPPAARRSLEQVGILSVDEGGFAPGAMAAQDPGLVHALLAGNNGQLVSRWGHVLLRRALASRLDAPVGMDPADFAALRAGLLLRMGENDAARALVQDVDAGNFTPLMDATVLDTAIATADLTAACPAVTLHGDTLKDPQWQIMKAICESFAGDENKGMLDLDRAMNRGTMSRIDILLAQKYAGAAGKARQAVTIEWNQVAAMTPWRYALTIATGLQPPDSLMAGAGPRYSYTAALTPMVPLATRAAAADVAGGAGVLSSAAMVDLYSQIYADEDITGDWRDRSEGLRQAYRADDARQRLAAMKALWTSGADPLARYSRKVLTAYAAARLPVEKDFAGDAPDLIASMLAAGLDQNAQRWAPFTPVGSVGWAQLMVAAPTRAASVSSGALESFNGDDKSPEGRRSRFLLAGLAGLGRVEPSTIQNFSKTVGVDLQRQTRWTRLIDGAAQVNNPALVAMLAGLGMQGDGWDKMTALHLFHIVSALNKVGLGAEARMIAAEAVARG